MVVQVKYASLPNFEEREEDFRAESVILRRRFTDQGAHFDGAVGDAHTVNSRSLRERHRRLSQARL